mgnify:FL=1
MNRTLIAALFAASTLVSVLPATGGPLDPDCTAEKAAKSAATKATVGVGGRCSPAEAAKDTAKNATGIGDGDRKKPFSGDGDRKKDKDDDKDNNRNKNKN